MDRILCIESWRIADGSKYSAPRAAALATSRAFPLTATPFHHALSHHDAVRIALIHRRVPTVRWLGFAEVLVATVAMLAVIPILALGLFAAPVAAVIYLGMGAAKVVAVAAGVAGVFGSIELPHRVLKRQAFTKYHHELQIVVTDRFGGTCGSAQARASSAEEGRTWVAEVLRRAAERQLVVVELVDDPLTCSEVWYGGRPLLAEPGVPAMSAAAGSLEADGAVLRIDDDAVEVRRQLASSGRVLGALLLVVIPLIAPALWLMRRPVGQALRRAWCDLRGASRWAVFRMTGGAIEVAEEVDGGSRAIDSVTIEGADLVGITWSPTLSWGTAAAFVPASLRVVGHDHTLEVPAAFVGPRGRTLRDFLVASMLLHSSHGDLTACPYCGTAHSMVAGAGCPSCGGWPEALAS
ncbi:MAG: hypothetical protein ACI9MC_000549 [Kiritimatiellia bacterium]|jgi:hypothetical protein